VSRLQNRSGCPHHSLGFSCVGIRPLLPKTGHGSARPRDRGARSPCSRCIGCRRSRRIGPLLGQGDNPPLTDLGNNGRPLLMVENGEIGDDRGQRHLSHPDIGGGERLRGRISSGPGRNQCRRRQQDRRTRGRGRISDLPRHDGRSNRGSTWEACPRTARAAWAPRRRVPCAEANQPAWRATAPAAEAGPILSTFVGASPAKPCLCLLKGRRGKFKTHSKITETEVPLDTYPLRGKTNRACGETPQALVSAGTAKGCPAAGFGAASASDAQGAEGAACPGDVTTAGGLTSRTDGTCTCSWGTCGSA
jgi:hypothetical protein